MQNEFIWILGPCSIEDYDNYINTAIQLQSTMGNRRWYYKASFDKANRKNLNNKRGPGLKASIELMSELKKLIPTIKLITDVHECHQVEQLAGIVDVIQIPAFLCRQTDLLIECGKHFDIVNIKRGQWLTPSDTAHFSDKIRLYNNDVKVWITERGTFFGYNRLIVDFNAASEMKNYCDHVILDCTHSTQIGMAANTGGDRTLAEKYLLASFIFDYDGIFAETHQNPPMAISDSDSQIYLNRIVKLIALREKLNTHQAEYKTI